MSKLICVLLICLSCSIAALAEGSSNCGSPSAAELVGKTFIAVQGCRAGNTYQTSTLTGYCTCWIKNGQKCGYICDNSAIPKPGSAKPVIVNGGIVFQRNNAKSRVRRQAACPPNPIPPNSRWLVQKNCIAGNVFYTSTETCTCCGMAGYTCTLTKPPTTLPPTPSTTPPTTATVAPDVSCPPSPFPANAESFLNDPGCSLLTIMNVSAIVKGESPNQLACICTSPVKCGMICYSLKEGEGSK